VSKPESVAGDRLTANLDSVRESGRAHRCARPLIDLDRRPAISLTWARLLFLCPAADDLGGSIGRGSHYDAVREVELLDLGTRVRISMTKGAEAVVVEQDVAELGAGVIRLPSARAWSGPPDASSCGGARDVVEPSNTEGADT
jgi:hypothetical protein